MTTTVEPGQQFREAWIAGVRKHYPGEPKPSYITPWQDTPDWERTAAAAVEQQIRSLAHLTDGAVTKFSPEQKGRFVALCWIGQILHHIEDPKPAYIADWPDLPEWQRNTDTDIFDAILTPPQPDHR